jgi:hypothetical protein
LFCFVWFWPFSLCLFICYLWIRIVHSMYVYGKWLIGWCLTLALAVFQLYRVVT